MNCKPTWAYEIKFEFTGKRAKHVFSKNQMSFENVTGVTAQLSFIFRDPTWTFLGPNGRFVYLLVVKTIVREKNATHRNYLFPVATHMLFCSRYGQHRVDHWGWPTSASGHWVTIASIPVAWSDWVAFIQCWASMCIKNLTLKNKFTKTIMEKIMMHATCKQLCTHIQNEMSIRTLLGNVDG